MSAWRDGYTDRTGPHPWRPPQDANYDDYASGWAAGRAMQSADRARKAAKKK